MPLFAFAFNGEFSLKVWIMRSSCYNKRLIDEWKMAGHKLLMFRGDFSQVKLRFAIYKGMVQHRLRKNGYVRLADGFEVVTDGVFRMLR
jgi:hypothetical protein